MTGIFDPRIVQVGIEIDGELILFEGLDIRAHGTKFFSPTQARCSIHISNMTKEHRNYILTKASPLNAPGKQQNPINVTLDVGRESYGTFRLFEGQAWAMGATQPPDIGITLESLTNNPAMGVIKSNSFGAIVPVSTIAKKIADQNGLTLDLKLTNDKQIANYSYNGPVNKQVQKLAEMGGINATVDVNKILLVRDAGAPRSDAVYLIDAAGGMIGVPQPNFQGCFVKTLITSAIQIGTLLQINSDINPAVNGRYTAWDINFEVANRDKPFWYNINARNNVLYAGTQ